MDKKYRRALKPDAQPFDEIRIVTRPYFKNSGLSGSEWRTRFYTQLYRKGNLVFEDEGYTSLESAVHLLSHTYLSAIDNGKGYFAGEADYCDQEGCSNKANVIYECLREGCGACGNTKEPEFFIPYRQFCHQHCVRGDSRLDDMDEHYKIITAEQLTS